MLRRFAEWLRQWLASPGATLRIVALCGLPPLPAITLGLAADDYWHKLALTGGYPEIAVVKSQWWNLFTFFDGDPERMHRFMDTGVAPWWSDLHARASFFRPVSSLTHVLDYALWPNSP